MTVTSEKQSTMASNSPPCGICRKVENTAVLWCINCGEGLCVTCFGCHKASNASRPHDTIDIEPYFKLPAEIRIVIFICSKHKEGFNNFCRKHDVPCCKTCVTEDHKECLDIMNIHEVTMNVKFSVAFTELEQTVTSVLRNIHVLQSMQDNNIKTLEDQMISIKEQIYTITKLDKIEESLLQELDSMVRSETNSFKATKQLLQTYVCRVQIFEESLSLLKSHASDLYTFFAMKEIDRCVTQIIKEAETDVGRVIVDIQIKFDKHQTIENITKDQFSSGTLSIERNTRNVNLQQSKHQVQIRSVPQNRIIDDIKVTLEQTVNTDGKDVNGCLILPDCSMVFACLQSTKVIVIKLDGSIDYVLEVKYPPYDLTYNSDTNHIIFSCLEKGIIVISVTERKLIKTINVNEPGGICWYKSSSVLYCTDGSINMVDLETGLVNTILTTDIEWGDYVDVFHDKIYFTKNETHTVSCCDINGNIVWNITDVVKSPYDLSVDPSGNVFVVDGEIKTIVVISGDAHHHRQIISAEDGLYEPSSIYFDHQHCKILVSSLEDGKAYLFNVCIVN